MMPQNEMCHDIFCQKGTTRFPVIYMGLRSLTHSRVSTIYWLGPYRRKGQIAIKNASDRVSGNRVDPTLYEWMRQRSAGHSLATNPENAWHV